jgi:hypothetical protein
MKFVLKYFLICLMSRVKFFQPKALGMLGEAMVEFHFWMGFNSRYELLNDVTIKLRNGGTTQLDHLILSPYGIFVIETKNYKGIIKGTVDDLKWKQTIGNRTYEFYNPIKQNESHSRVVKGIVSGILPAYHVHNIVVFTKRSKHKRGWFGFGAKLPEHVHFGYSWVRYVKKFSKKVLSQQQLEEIRSRIDHRTLDKGMITNAKHVFNVKFRNFRKR